MPHLEFPRFHESVRPAPFLLCRKGLAEFAAAIGANSQELIAKR